MKRMIALVSVLTFLFLVVGCGHNMTIEGKKVETVGLINIAINDESTMAIKRPDVKYRVIWGNVIWGAVLFGTAIAPIYFYGFSMFEPVEKIQ
jgi:hypothetical protein